MWNMLFDKMNDKFPDGYRSDNPKQPSKRSEVRRLVILKAKLHPVEKYGHAHIVNLSRTGMRGVTDMTLTVGQTLFVSLDDITHRSGVVRWIDQRRFGMLFDTMIDGLPEISQPESGSNGIHRSRPPRITTNLIAKIRLCGPSYAAKIRNISKSGMMVETEMALVAGRQIFIQMSNNKVVPAETKWSQGSRSGVHLTSPISILQFTYGDLQ
jgi:PilZ domain